MDGFRHFLARQPISIIFKEDDAEALRCARVAIEEGKEYQLGKGWLARVDKPHVQGQKQHVHFYQRGKEVHVLNLDGTPSHGGGGAIPSSVKTKLRAKGVNLSENALLLESAAGGEFSTPKSVMQSLRFRLRLAQLR
ncbi:hypothetical protein M2360_003371 [Rhizobium sp. SG_E_25_P2]|uniref:hypothetical protein n=1 Tax=Rhizobium sp. SG_E_25_P2 TaxID=2879942 RepID=UPI0024768294|nr:hypothetical protein [Rhizobium sp. SG_E_25_P2]MDH6267968.1 hypothetical protein [Rhizobium sp. SG_E_25_P2]